ARSKMSANTFGGTADVAQIRLTGLGQRCGNADDDGINICKAGEVAGGIKSAGTHQLGDSVRLDVADVALAFTKLLDLGNVNIEAEYGVAAGREAFRQRQADIAQTDNSNPGTASLD